MLNHAATGSSKVFVIGLSRTGTASVTRALELLGYSAVHFPHDEISRMEISEYIRKPSSSLRLSVLDSVRALSDTPVSAVYKGLDHSYPGSRFILTLRSKPGWLASCEAYWAKVLQPLLEDRPAEAVAYIRLVNRAIYGTDRFHPAAFSAAYDKHILDVRDYFRARREDLLELDICGGAGWRDLCAFLGTYEPRQEFPHENRIP